MTFVSPPALAGDYIVLRAEIDTVIVLSACPMDLVPTNGPTGETKPVEYQLL